MKIILIFCLISLNCADFPPTQCTNCLRSECCLQTGNESQCSSLAKINCACGTQSFNNVYLDKHCPCFAGLACKNNKCVKTCKCKKAADCPSDQCCNNGYCNPLGQENDDCRKLNDSASMNSNGVYNGACPCGARLSCNDMSERRSCIITPGLQCATTSDCGSFWGGCCLKSGFCQALGANFSNCEPPKSGDPVYESYCPCQSQYYCNTRPAQAVCEVPPRS